MKGYRKFLFGVIAILIIYVVAEVGQPKPLDWTMTLSKGDQNPLGGYILYQQLSDIFPDARIDIYSSPVTDQIKSKNPKNTAYLLFGPVLNLSSNDCDELFKYVASGNYVFLSTNDFSQAFMDTFKIKTSNRFGLVKTDSNWVSLTNPSMGPETGYSFRSPYFEEYITHLDSAATVVLGKINSEEVNFVKIAIGEGAFFIHTSPICFSNYFLVRNNNAEYAAKALSYIPHDISAVYWDEYYKQSHAETSNPMRFMMSNPDLRWVYWIVLLTLVLYLLFASKRRQRIIPVMEPLRNSTLDFVNTVGKLYFNQHDNRNIAVKKINYFLEYIRTNLFLSTGILNTAFEDALTKKTGLPREEIADLIRILQEVDQNQSISDLILLELNKRIDKFYVNLR
jgi:hypothetical protein